ncbi:O-antigen ligase family protein [Flavobacterium sp. JP2137]|uniref:O-antigen ligase family protein n=1 Tax=Flavobacterium sp. JP2137 TaxID=3414510 RepID=UPI003D2FE7ED
MKISDEKYQKGFNLLLLLIGCTFFFSKLCTWFIIIFAVYNLVFFKRSTFPKKGLVFALIIASPMLLELLFFWKNDSPLLGWKSAEKSVSLLIFPFFILSNYKHIPFFKILDLYAKATTAILLVLLLRFLIVEPDLVHKYLNRIDLWEMGYQFAESFKNHAPAVNMHLTFVAILNFYFLLRYLQQQREKWLIALQTLILLASIMWILIVNTRISLLNVTVGFGIVIFVEAFKYYKAKTIILGSISFFSVMILMLFLFVQLNPYMKEKYSTSTFAYMDKVGKLDEIENPESAVFNAFVTRVSIWKSAWELSQQSLLTGYGSSNSKPALTRYYEQTNQHFLAKYAFPTHNQFLDFLLKFGILGILVVFGYVFLNAYLGLKTHSGIMLAFFFNFFTSNLVDDFLIRFDGIVFSGLWTSLFVVYYLQRLDLPLVNRD